jgi:hypothetical protein
VKELGFDPIEHMVKTYQKIEKRIAEEDKKDRPSSIAIATLLSTQQKSINDLMRYGYARQSETSVIETKQPPPMMVHLTTKDGTAPVMVTGERAPEMEDDGDEGEDLYDQPPEVPEEAESMSEEPKLIQVTVDDL